MQETMSKRFCKAYGYDNRLCTVEANRYGRIWIGDSQVFSLLFMKRGNECRYCIAYDGEDPIEKLAEYASQGYLICTSLMSIFSYTIMHANETVEELLVEGDLMA